jgi:hypothetical protein
MYIDMLEWLINNYESNELEKYRSAKYLKNMKNTLVNIDRIRKQDYKVSLEPLTREWVDSLNV